jgi:hypothetical protein
MLRKNDRFLIRLFFSMDGADGLPMGAANSTLNMSHMDQSGNGLNQVSDTFILINWSR